MRCVWEGVHRELNLFIESPSRGDTIRYKLLDGLEPPRERVPS